MADVITRPYDLDEETVNDLSYFIIIDDPGFPEPKKMNVANFLEPEATLRADADDTIEASCGLETDGTFSPDDTSHYVRSVDFVTAGVSADLKNAISLLDSAIYALNNKLFLDIYYNLSSVNILNLHSAALTIFASLPGYLLNPIFCLTRHIFGTTAYTTISNDMEFQINGVTVMKIPFELWGTGASSIYKSNGLNEVPLKSNTALILTRTGEYTLGDGTGRTRVTFELVDENLSGALLTGGCCNIPQTGTFVDADLDGANKLVIQHNLNTQYILGVSIKDNAGAVTTYPFTVGDAGGLNPNDYITVDLTAVSPIAGTWTYYFIAIQI